MGYTTEQANNFINMIAPLMLAEGHSRGYNIISTAIAQAVIEGAAGTSTLAKTYHNHFGLKCGSSWIGKSVNMRTQENYGAGLVNIRDNFRVYDNDIEGVKGYYNFINTKRYANLKTAKNYIEYANYLKLDGYATSTTYISTLCSTVRKYSLDKFDAYGSLVSDVASDYKIGNTYTLQSDVYIRKEPNGDKVTMDDITNNAKKNAFADEEGNVILKKGTRVTCKGIKTLNNSTWLQIPSGYVCAKNSSKVFIK